MAAMDLSSEGLKRVVPGYGEKGRGSQASRWPVWKSLTFLAGASIVLWCLIIGGLFLIF